MVSKSSRQQQQTTHTTRVVIALSDESQQRIAPATHHTSPPQQAGRAYCLWFGFRANSVVLKMLIQAPGNLLCFAVELCFFLRDHSRRSRLRYLSRPPRLNTSSIVFLHLMLPPHPAHRGCVVVCVVFKPSCWFRKLIRSL